MQRIEKSAGVGLSQTARADAELALTSVAEEITVTAAPPPAVETTEIAASFDVETINQLPTGRTIDDIVALSPGVTEAGPNDQITISGSMSFESLFLVNGVVVNENVRGQPNPLYIEDAVQETTVLTGGVSAEFGRFPRADASARRPSARSPPRALSRLRSIKVHLPRLRREHLE